MARSSLNELPEDILAIIMRDLDAQDLAALCQTSRALRRVVRCPTHVLSRPLTPL
jgi:hypothetical protein